MLNIEESIARLLDNATKPKTPWSPCTLRKLPPEIRAMIYSLDDVLELQIDGRTPTLLVALEPDKELYKEASSNCQKRNLSIKLSYEPSPEVIAFLATPTGQPMLSQVERVRIIWDTVKFPRWSVRKERESKRTDQICVLLAQCKKLRTFMLHIPYYHRHDRRIEEIVQLLGSVRFERLEIASNKPREQYLSMYNEPQKISTAQTPHSRFERDELRYFLYDLEFYGKITRNLTFDGASSTPAQ